MLNFARRSLAGILISLAAIASPISAWSADPSARPNIILILADDLGYGDLGCYGQQRIKTPRLDQMATEGLRFTDFYAGCTVCAPSRCVLMTGYHMGHAYVRGNAGRGNREIQILRDRDVTVAEVLKQAGYATALCGKWGLGQEGSVGAPNKQGFDYFFGYLDQFHAHNYYPAYLLKNEERYPLKNVVPGEGEFGSGVATEKVQYSADLITAEALKWVEEHKDGPFFLYYAPTLPHANNEGRNEGMEVPDLGEYASTDWPPQQKAHAAMISRLDSDVGRLLDLLKKLNIDDQTLVLFSSDNGPHREGGNDPDFNDSNGPLKGIKRDLTEGGIRVPFLARWPGQIAPGTSSFVGGFQDILPTFAELAGANSGLPADTDGLSIVPTLLTSTRSVSKESSSTRSASEGSPQARSASEGRQKQHDYLYWLFYERGAGQAARIGPWKAVQQPYHSPVRLYNLENDIGEQHNVAAEHPEIVARLTAAMKAAYKPHENWPLPTASEAAGPSKAKAAKKGP